MSEEGRGGSGSAGRSRDRLASSTLGALRRGGRDASVAPSDPDVTEDVITEGVITEDGVEPGVIEPAVVEPETAEDVVEPLVDEPETAEDVVEPAVVTPPARGRRRPSRWTTVCALVAFAALVFTVVTGVLWWTAGHSHDRDIGLARDRISTDARLAIVTVNTSDYRRPTAALDNWLRVSTGSLHSQFSQSRSAAAKLLGEAKMVTKATVLDAAVTNVNLTKGTAGVIASVNVTRTPVTGSVSTVRNRFRATMTRVGSQWKLSDLAVVPVSLS